MLRQWTEISPLSILYAYGLYFSSHLIRALRINSFLLHLDNTRFTTICKISSYHQLANNYLPMRLGEFAFPLLVKRYFNLSLADGFGQLLWLRGLDALVIFCLLFGVFILAKMSWLILIGTAMFATLTAALLFYALYHAKFIQKFKILTALRDFAPKSLGEYSKLFSLTVAAWFCKLSAFIIIIVSLTGLPIDVAMFSAIGAEISSFIPVHGVAGAGTFEAAFVAAAAVLQQSTADVLPVAINLHIFVLLASMLTVGIFLPFNAIRINENSHDAVTKANANHQP